MDNIINNFPPSMREAYEQSQVLDDYQREKLRKVLGIELPQNEEELRKKSRRKKD